MTENHKAILHIIEQFLIANPEQRFGQALFNLKVNEFTGKTFPEVEINVCRDIYNDSDEAILERMRTKA